MNHFNAEASMLAQAAVARLLDNLARAIVGHDRTLRHLLAAYLTHGHVLLEDFPGTGKTTLAKALAASVGLSFSRIQCTPDLLPADILGVSIYSPNSETFIFHRGPIFADIVLADEINRASPRTQSALLEAMAERQVTLDVTTHALTSNFFVIATQNPVEFQGTYPLPEAQFDRFTLCLSLGYIDEQTEVKLVRERAGQMSEPKLDACVSSAELAAINHAIDMVPCADELLEYAVKLVAATRRHIDITLGASPRASLALVRCARALALIDGDPYVAPEKIQELAVPALAHRLSLTQGAHFQGLRAADLVRDILRDTPAPR